MGYLLTTGPAIEPVTLAEARAFLELDEDLSTADNQLLELVLIPTARRACEKATGRALLTQAWRLTLPGFGCRPWIELDRNPVISITGITYLASGGATVTLPTTVYKLNATSETTRAYVALRENQVWPLPANESDAVRIDFTAGYGPTREAVPEGLRHWILMRVRSLWLYRAESEELLRGRLERPAFIDGLLDPYRIPTA